MESQDSPPPLPLKGQKRPREVEYPANHIPTERPRKRLRPLPAGPSLGQTFGQEAVSSISASQKSHTDRQNAHSMTVAMKGVVELFRGVGREQELHRQILGFSYSHDHESVRIWGHYPVINEDKTTFWRYPIRKFDFTERRGLEKWAAWTFTKNVYDIWVTPHLKRICSAIDDLPPEQDFALPQQSEPLPSEASGLSQQFENQALEQDPGSQSSHVDLQQITPATSTQPEPASKRKRKDKI